MDKRLIGPDEQSLSLSEECLHCNIKYYGLKNEVKSIKVNIKLPTSPTPNRACLWGKDCRFLALAAGKDKIRSN